YLSPATPDSALFAGFDTDDRFRTGAYELRVDASGSQYRLLNKEGALLDAGVVGDSVGRKLGFRWKPSAASLTRNKNVKFTLVNFRVQTITLPTENAAAGAGGQRARDPVFESFFSQKYESDNIQRDRLALETTLAAVQRRQLDPSSLWSVPAVQTSPTPELKAALSDFTAKQAALAAAQRIYTEDHKNVRDLKAEVEELRSQTIPRL